MPGPASHLTIIELQIARAANDPQHFGGPVLDALVNHQRHAALGSMGPDMIFWADWGEYTPVVHTVFDIYQTIDEVYDKLAAIWQPIDDAIDKVVNTLTGGLAGEISETVSLLEGIIESALLKLITEQIDVLALLKPDVQTLGSQSKIKDWNWLDYTHHRWTGDFGKALVRRAHQTSDPALRAYALGWLSHVTADVVGHPYVNTAVGGPYRSHWQRHFIQEKFMDTWVWGFYHTAGVSMPASVLPGEIPFDYANWTNVNGSALHQRIDLGDDMPSSLQKLIVQALRDVYLPRSHPNVKGTIPFLEEEHINRAYQMLLQGLELMTSKDRFLPRPEPPSVFNDDAPPTFPTPGGGSGTGSGGSSGGSFSLASLLMAILDFIKDLFEYIHDLVLWLASQVTFPLTYPVRYALYLLQLALYEIYRQYRWALCLSGYAFPDPDQLFNPLAQQFINPLVAVQTMPRREFPVEQDNCLFFPAGCVMPQTPGCVEPIAAMSGPYTRFPLNYPFWFIEGEPTNPDVEKALAEATSPGRTIEVTRSLIPAAAEVAGLPYKGSLGSAIDFFLRRAREVALDGGGETKLDLPDWNLDGDRGYGFKCWQVTANALEPPPPTGVKTTYNVDPNQP
jgi:hypothetical protein